MCLLEQCRLTRKSVNHLRPPQDGLTFQFHYFVADFRWALSGIQNIRSIPKKAQDCSLSPNFHSQLTQQELQGWLVNLINLNVTLT